MLNISEQTLFIDPRLSDAEKLAAMLRHQGDMRGYHLPDGTLLIFDSYGNTHESISRFFNERYFSKETRKWFDLGDALIFRLDGAVWHEGLRKNSAQLTECFDPREASLIERIYKLLGITKPYLTSLD